MSLQFVYGNGVLALPAAVLPHCSRATKKDLAVLMALACDPLLGADTEGAKGRAAAALSVSMGDVEAAIGFWRGAGILADADAAATPVQPVQAVQPVQTGEKEVPKVVADGGLPAYSTEELAGVLERRQGLSALIDECQRVMGKVFNTREIGMIAGLRDYLELTEEYIILLLSHCVRMEKKSMRYVEKMAISLHDEGVTEASDLEERLQRIEVMSSAIGKIRTMFGLSSRALTAKEKGMVENWLCVMKYEDDVLRAAYEVMVNAIGKASIPYANSILERWHAAGYRTLADVEQAIAAYRQQKTNAQGSFDVDDFFEAALKRSYGDIK